MIAIIRKELREWFSGGATGRYGQYEYLIYIALFGVGFPLLFAFMASSGPKHGGAPPIGPFIGATLPIFLLIYAMADAFAGERERGTLETLLVTPLRSVDIVVGKWLAGIGYAAGIMIATSVLGSVVSLLVGSKTVPFGLLAVVMSIALLIGGLLGAIEIIISLKAPTVKSAVFALNIAFVIIVVGVTQLLAKNMHTVDIFIAPILAFGSTGVLLLGAGVVTLLLAIIAALLWVATQQLRAMRFE